MPTITECPDCKNMHWQDRKCPCSAPGGTEWEWINRRRVKLINRDVRSKNLSDAEKQELAALEIVADLRCDHKFPANAHRELPPPTIPENTTESYGG